MYGIEKLIEDIQMGVMSPNEVVSKLETINDEVTSVAHSI